MRLDPTQPYVEVLGMPGVAFEQNGRRFNPAGHELVVTFSYDVDGRETVTSEAPAVATPEADLVTQPVEGDFETMHWRHLKALVESYGHDWTNKEDAVAYLRGVAV